MFKRGEIFNNILAANLLLHVSQRILKIGQHLTSYSSKLISAYGCMDFSSYFQVGSKSRSVGPGLSRRPPSAGQAPLAALRGSLGLDV